MTEQAKISGKRADLDGGRYVFVGLCDEHPNTVYIEFKNVEGDLTKLAISAEARDALAALLGSVRRPEHETWMPVT